MARPAKTKRICCLPGQDYFGPLGCPVKETVVMTLEEYETLRLIDWLDCTQEDCAKQMGVARTTVQAVYGQARKKLAEALIYGKGLKISGGSYELCPRGEGCCRKNCINRQCSEIRCGGKNQMEAVSLKQRSRGYPSKRRHNK